jgi:hypothetical protein
MHHPSRRSTLLARVYSCVHPRHTCAAAAAKSVLASRRQDEQTIDCFGRRWVVPAMSRRLYLEGRNHGKVQAAVSLRHLWPVRDS